MSSVIDICFPEDQQEGTEATVTRWMVTEGDDVAAHEPVVEVETDKVVVEVAAPEAGRITHIKIRQDEEVNPGDVLCTLDTGTKPGTAEETETGSKEPKDETVIPMDRNRLSPAVRRLVQKHDLDLTDVAGTGRDGRITLQDVELLVAGQEPGHSPEEQPIETDSPPAPPSGQTETIAHDKMRKRLADNMVASLMHTAPHVTAVFEADMSAVMRHRATHKEVFAKAGTPLTLTAYFVLACIAAIQKVPRVNSRWFDEYLEIYHRINVGIGTALGNQGLIVPVLHDAQNMNLKAIATRLSDLTTRARDGRLLPEDVRGGTFTISNHGVSGSLVATPIIINQPQSAILGVGKIEKRVKIVEHEGEDHIAIKPMCYVSLTIDHRVLDAYQTNAFLAELVSTLENWS